MNVKDIIIVSDILIILNELKWVDSKILLEITKFISIFYISLLYLDFHEDQRRGHFTYC